MCIPHAPNNLLPDRQRHEKEGKRHIEFDPGRLEGDPDFVDERKMAEKREAESGFFDFIRSLFFKAAPKD